MLFLINSVSNEVDWGSTFVASSYKSIVSGLSQFVKATHFVLCLLYRHAFEIFIESVKVIYNL